MTLLLTALATAQQEVTAYTNAHILPGGKPTISNATMVVSGGKILALGGADVKVPDGAKVIDCKGMTITPGLIDASFQSSNNQQDLNEQSEEVTPHLRILDNIDPEDPLFRRARNNGVTAVHIMPGTRNVIGGLGCVIKTYGSDPKSMVIKADASMRIVMGAEPSN
ncbi:MAG TPA: hypothetical protein EYP98_20505, partial [Planctomycetes bacterium]|nr:hypothetical protein [Planctomycetota bacterium]